MAEPQKQVRGHGDTWLKSTLCLAGVSAARIKSTYLSVKFK
ncbi:hypothetical protein ACFXDI_42045 [Streptomyces mirabilis]